MNFCFLGKIKGSMIVEVKAKNKAEALEKILNGEFKENELLEWEFIDVRLNDIEKN